ncbi:MAG: bifunctional DNA primase/polymerase [Planctomycetes bacterium]|nr:bifunctional DNA primase/polymerase [Planctomycetota bacterium]
MSMATNTHVDNLATATIYAVKWGWHVFPVHTIVDGACTCRKRETCSSRGKHPRTRNGFKAATTDLAQISRWSGGQHRHRHWGPQQACSGRCRSPARWQRRYARTPGDARTAPSETGRSASLPIRVLPSPPIDTGVSGEASRRDASLRKGVASPGVTSNPERT